MAVMNEMTPRLKKLLDSFLEAIYADPWKPHFEKKGGAWNDKKIVAVSFRIPYLAQNVKVPVGNIEKVIRLAADKIAETEAQPKIIAALKEYDDSVN